MHRYDQIMAEIDAGMTDEQLAEKYCAKSELARKIVYRHAVQIMYVYRMAHDGTLCTIKRGNRPCALTIDDLLAIIRGD